MYQVGDDEQAVFLKEGVAGRVAVGTYGEHSAGKGVARFEQVEVVLVDSHDGMSEGGSIFWHGFPGLRFYVVDP